MKWLERYILPLSVLAGGVGSVLMFLFLFNQPVFFNKPVHPGFKNTIEDSFNYLRTYPKTIYMVWFAIARMAFYCIIIMPLLYFFIKEWQQIKKGTKFKTTFIILTCLAPLLLIRIYLSLESNESDTIKDLVFANSSNYLLFVSVFGIIIGLLTSFGIMMIAIRSAHSHDTKDYESHISGINRFLLLLGITISFSTVWHLLLRNAYVQVNTHSNYTQPIEWIYGIALTNTLLIALVYLPARIYVEYMKYKNIDLLLNMQQLQQTGWQLIVNEFKTAIPILSPLLTTILAELLA